MWVRFYLIIISSCKPLLFLLHFPDGFVLLRGMGVLLGSAPVDLTDKSTPVEP